MPDFEDYYEVLQVHFLAEPEVIKKAFTALAYKYHPDRNPGSGAAARMQKINVAYTVLSDTGKRRLYDAEWIARKQPAGPHGDKPKPAVEPNIIKFVDVIPREPQRSSFLILNAGGSCKKIWFSDPDSWVKVANYYSLTGSDELPLKVEIEARGEAWDTSYVDSIQVKLDDEETFVRIELSTQKQPVSRPQPVRKRKVARHSNTGWQKWAVGLAAVAMAVFVVTKLMLPSTAAGVMATDASIPPVVAPVPAPSPIPAPLPQPVLPPVQPAARFEFKQVDIFPIADFAAPIDSFPAGIQTFNGIGFSLSKSIFMTRCAVAYLPNEGVLTVDIVHPQEVFILINTKAASAEFMDRQVGKITLKFDDGAIQETLLIVGQNIREYTLDGGSVRTVYDPANGVAWQGGPNRRFAIDMLAIPIDWRNQVGSLRQIIITDTSETTANSVDPGLIVWGLVVGHTE
jgi:hypothetical protein